jgi:serine phosphatase RsbU (regulator of sigma subunit)
MKKTYRKKAVLIALTFSLLILIPLFAKNTGIFGILQKLENDEQETAIPKGFPYIVNFSGNKTEAFPVQSISQDEDGLMLFLNHRGLILFNGSEERFIEFDTKLHSLRKDEKNGIIYAIGSNNFGILKKTAYYDYRFNSLLPENDSISNFNKILFSDKKAWFVGPHAIYSVNKNNPDSAEQYYQNDSITINDAFFLKENLYICIKNKGLFNLKRLGKGNFVADAEALKNSEIIFHIPYEKKIILGTNQNKLYLFDGEKLENYQTEIDEYFEESIIAGASDFGYTRFAVTTLSGGAAIINKEDGTEEALINYRTGLPDDEIFASYTDSEKGLWLSHEFGVSRLLPDLPVNFYDNFPGKEGKVYDISVKDSTLYLATGQGVFYLSEIKDFKEIEELVTTQIPQKETNREKEAIEESLSENKAESEESKTEINEEDKTEETGALKKLWRRIRGKDKDNEKESTEESTEDSGTEEDKRKLTENTEEKTEKRRRPSRNNTTQKAVRYTTVKQSKKIYELQSIKYQFKQAEKINGKCKQFQAFGNGVLTASNIGLFYIEKLQVSEVLAGEYIYNIAPTQSPDRALVLSDKALYQIIFSPEGIEAQKIHYEPTQYTPLSVINGYSGEILLAGVNHLSVLQPADNTYETLSYGFETRYPENITLKTVNDTVYILSSEEAFKWADNELTAAPKMNRFRSGNCDIFYVQNNAVSICNNGSVNEFSEAKVFTDVQLQMLYTEKNISRIYADPDGNIWLIGDFNRIMKIDKHSAFRGFSDLQLQVVRFKGNFIKEIKNNELTIKEGFDSIAVSVSAPSYFSREKVEYTYSIDGVTRTIDNSKDEAFFILNSLPTGKHELIINARDQLNRTSNTLQYTLTVKAHFYNTVWFYILILVLLSGGVWLVSNRINARKRRLVELHNQELEREVERRTEKIRKQNEEILERNRKIEQQNQEIKTQSTQIHEKNQEITDSINYAERIQSAALPPEDVLSEIFSDHFIFFKPRDIISGDFYWVRQFENKVFIAAVDCTGHGVPGGFVSMLGISFLNEIIDRPDISTGTILNKLRDKVIDSLHQTKANKSRDGMDLALISVDTETRVLEYSGAHNPLILIRNGELYRVKGDRMPVGYSRKKDVPFATHEVNILKGDQFYTFSDGFSDQFGGNNKRKFTSGRFNKLIYELHSLSMPNQKKTFEELFEKWKGNISQMDDLLVIGIKI